tara:strand:- start:2 stop:865 length:864 start_codon:yes stop_codon:yes gene_type:complete
MKWDGKLQKDEEVTGYIPIALSSMTMAQLTKPNGRRRYVIDLFNLEGKLGSYRTVFPSVTTEVEGQLRNFGMEKWKDGWIKRGLDKYVGQVLDTGMIDEILTSHTNEAQTSAKLGTQVHTYIDKLLKDEDVNDIPHQLEPAIQGFLKWRRKYIDWEYIGSELGVYSTKYAVAGTIDALFNTPDGYVIVDWKTSSGIYDSHAIQVSVYAEAFRHMTKKRKLAGAMVVRFGNSYPLVGNEKDRTMPKVFTDRVETMHLSKIECEIYAEEIRDLRNLKFRHARKLEKERF